MTRKKSLLFSCKSERLLNPVEIICKECKKKFLRDSRDGFLLCLDCRDTVSLFSETNGYLERYEAGRVRMPGYSRKKEPEGGS